MEGLLHFQDFTSKLKNAAAMLIDAEQTLTAIDAQFGDGDHGMTIKKIAYILTETFDGEAEANVEEDVGKLLLFLSAKLMGLSGGSAGPLWATMFEGLGNGATGKTQLTGDDVAAMLCSAVSELAGITSAKVGDKTMMDTLIPAAQAAKEKASGSPQEVFEAAAEAGRKGCEDTKNYISKFGRAKSYKEKTLGTPDAGAVSLSIFLEGLAK